MTKYPMDKRSLEYRRFALQSQPAAREARALDGEADGKIVGYAIVWNSDSEDMGFIERIAPGAATRTLAEAADGSWNVTFQWEHDAYSAASVPLASTRSGLIEFTVDDHGLKFEVDPKRFSVAQIDALRCGDMQMSFGMTVQRHSVEMIDDVPHREIEELTLYEISAVQSPAYQATEVGVRSDPTWLTELRAATGVVEMPEIVTEVTADHSEDIEKINFRRSKKAALLSIRLDRASRQ